MITVDFWGPYACFTAPYAKVERLSMDIPTPSVVRGMLNAIYGKPQEFWWQVVCIEVMRPLKQLIIKRNETDKRMPRKVDAGTVLDLSDSANRTQHTSVLLKDVKYRVTADIVPRDVSKKAQICAQAERRIRKGQCFMQPCFGIREYEAYFGPADMQDQPVVLNRDLGLIVYDVHDPTACQPGYSGMDLSLFHGVIRDGVMDVPAWGSSDVIVLQKGGGLVAEGIV